MHYFNAFDATKHSKKDAINKKEVSQYSRITKHIGVDVENTSE